MARYTTTLVVPVDAETAFDYLARFSTTQEWDPGVTRGTMVTPEPVGQGSRFAISAGFLGRTVDLDYRIVDIDRPHRVTLVADNGKVRSEDTITVEAVGADQAKVTYDAVLTPLTMSALMNPILNLVFRRIGDRATAGLQSTLTAKAARA